MLIFNLRLASQYDAKFLWELRNDDDVRANAFDDQEIKWEAHCMWLENKLALPSCRIWILENESHLPVGQIRYDKKENIAEIDYAIVKQWRGLGCGKTILERSLFLARAELRISKLIAIVKEKNLSSAKTFESAGFIFTQRVEYHCQCCFQYEYLYRD